MNWLNQADTEYRMQLRELNDVNYARFEAKLDQRFAEQDARWEKRFAEQGAKLADLAATLRAQPEIIQGHLMKWMIVFWATTILAIVGVR